jgi:hypothetical protein
MDVCNHNVPTIGSVLRNFRTRGPDYFDPVGQIESTVGVGNGDGARGRSVDDQDSHRSFSARRFVVNAC